jgi:hypothetical protein
MIKKYNGGRTIDAMSAFLKEQLGEDDVGEPPLPPPTDVLVNDGLSLLTDANFANGVANGWTFVKCVMLQTGTNLPPCVCSYIWAQSTHCAACGFQFCALCDVTPYPKLQPNHPFQIFCSVVRALQTDGADLGRWRHIFTPFFPPLPLMRAAAGALHHDSAELLMLPLYRATMFLVGCEVALLRSSLFLS